MGALATSRGATRSPTGARSAGPAAASMASSARTGGQDRRRGGGGAQVKARAVWFAAPRRVEVRPVEVPEVADGEVLVQSAWSGISAGTEMLAYRGEVDPDLPLDETLGALEGGTFSYPFPYGYSCVGTVERSRGPVPEGSLVFAYHPHQDRFVVPATDVVALEGEP